MNTSNYIPRDVLLQAEIRSIDEPEMKAAVICNQNPNLKITPLQASLVLTIKGHGEGIQH